MKGVDEERLGALLEHDQGMREPGAAGGRVERERAKRELDAHALRYVEKGAALPERGVECLELAERRGHGLGHEVPLDEVGMLANRRVQIGEDDPLGGERRVGIGVDGARALADRDPCPMLGLADLERVVSAITGDHPIERRDTRCRGL